MRSWGSVSEQQGNDVETMVEKFWCNRSRRTVSKVKTCE